MDAAEHSVQPPQLPAKLRWRPYGNGNTLKQKKVKKEDPQQVQQSSKKQDAASDLNPKALAHRVRSAAQGSSKARHAPTTVQLQWEEAETIESMSHGGHPQNQHPAHHQPQQLGHSNVDISTNSTHTTPSDSATSSLPSPTSSNSPSIRLVLFDRDPDLSHYVGTVPGLTGADFSQHGLALPTFEANAAYQVALNALLENHRRNQLLDAQAPALALASVPTPMSMTGPPATLTDSGRGRSMFSPSHANSNNYSSSDSQRKLSTSELLGIVNIDDLLTSCGYTDTDDGSATTISAGSSFASPAMTDQSLFSSPINFSIDLHASHMNITTAESLDRMMTQTPVLLAEGDSKQQLLQQQQQQQQQQQRRHQQLNTSPTQSVTSTISNSFAEIFHDLASPFLRMSSYGDPLIDGSGSPSTWSSLFPHASEEDSRTSGVAKRVDMATQTEQPYEPQQQQQPSPPSSSIISPQISPALSRSKLDEEPNSEWLSFLDEASPLFTSSAENEIVGESSTGKTSSRSSPLLSHLSEASAPVTAEASRPITTATNSTLQDQSLRSWAGEYLQAGSLAPTGHRGFPMTGSMGSLGGGPGGLIRSLHGNSFPQRSGYHTKTRTPRRTTGSGNSSLIRPSFLSKNTNSTGNAKDQLVSNAQEKTTTAFTQEQASDNCPKSEVEGVGGLVYMFRGLWKSEK